MRLHGFRAQMSYDLLTGWDLESPATQARVLRGLACRRPKVVMLSSPCTPFSKLQNLSKGKRCPMKQAEQLETGRELLRFSMRVAKMQLDRHDGFCHEHPTGASSWAEDCVQAVLNQPSVKLARFHQCMFGLKSKLRKSRHKEPTTLLTNVEHVVLRFGGVYCDKHQGEAHVQIHGREGGMRRSEYAQIYPEPLCKNLVACFAAWLAETQQG